MTGAAQVASALRDGEEGMENKVREGGDEGEAGRRRRRGNKKTLGKNRDNRTGRWAVMARSPGREVPSLGAARALSILAAAGRGDVGVTMPDSD